VVGLCAPEGPPRLYTGAYLGALAGAGVASDAGEVGWSGTVGVRASSVLHLADVEARYQVDGVATDRAHQGMLAMHLHPLFLFLLANNTLGATLGSLAVEVAAGPAWSERNGSGLLWSWGGSFEVPLTPPDAGQSLWLGSSVTFSHDLAYSALAGEVTNRLIFRLEYRHNGL